jgi:hypothetical protein
LSYDQVIEILGPMSDVIVAEIIATGITKDELSALCPLIVSGPDNSGGQARLEGERLSPASAGLSNVRPAPLACYRAGNEAPRD